MRHSDTRREADDSRMSLPVQSCAEWQTDVLSARMM